ncbi:MAG: hypothetical protein AB7O98_15300 [Hyphomonadaceae bacterium]
MTEPNGDQGGDGWRDRLLLAVVFVAAIASAVALWNGVNWIEALVGWVWSFFD